MLTASDTTWRYIQTGDPTRATLFFSEDLRRADGSVVPGPTEDVLVTVTAEEQAVLAAIIERGRAAFVEKKNAEQPQP
jgi:hypothetical protein